MIPEIIVLYIYQLAKFGELMNCGSKDTFKNNPSHILILIMMTQNIAVIQF